MNLSIQEKLDCQLHLWQPKYRSVTFKTRSIPLPQEFIDYLLEDGIRNDASTSSSSRSSSTSPPDSRMQEKMMVEVLHHQMMVYEYDHHFPI